MFLFYGQSLYCYDLLFERCFAYEVETGVVVFVLDYVVDFYLSFVVDA